MKNIKEVKDTRTEPELVNQYSNPATAEEGLKRTEAEVRMAVLTASANVPLAFHDQLSPAI